jgi:hypothetical protein
MKKSIFALTVLVFLLVGCELECIDPHVKAKAINIANSGTFTVLAKSEGEDTEDGVNGGRSFKICTLVLRGESKQEFTFGFRNRSAREACHMLFAQDRIKLVYLESGNIWITNKPEDLLTIERLPPNQKE